MGFDNFAALGDCPGYVVVTSGTCQSAGYKPLKTATECRAAALALGYKDDWGPHGGYDDVVDGCSVRFGTDLFQNPVGQCRIGANTPSWIPLLNGKTDCQCSVYQPCLCEDLPICQCHDSYDWKSFGQTCSTHCMATARHQYGVPYCHPGAGSSSEPCGRKDCGPSEVRCRYSNGTSSSPPTIAPSPSPSPIPRSPIPSPSPSPRSPSPRPSPSAEGYVVVTSGTCQSAGYKPLKTATECRAAALALGYKDDWGPHGGYDDVVDGCSVRFGTDLFQNPVGQCRIGANTPSWIPLLNGKTDCQCSVYQPCLCEGASVTFRGTEECEDPAVRRMERMRCPNIANLIGSKCTIECGQAVCPGWTEAELLAACAEG